MRNDDIKNEKPLNKKYKNHFLKGEYDGQQETHIEPDWLIIYETDTTDVYFTRTGSHSELFKK
ncbi:MAG: type II toxin-antitoxin system YafQ family toxin [Clostridiales bacterium]|nr:type II toxin-antitoxin system YafQ family toxin [Clostridiales bacterium]